MSMKVFAKPFEGVRDGEIYPTQFQPGEECPPELEAGAISLGALVAEGGGPGKTPEKMNVDELKAALDGKGVQYAQDAKKAELLAALLAALKASEVN